MAPRVGRTTPRRQFHGPSRNGDVPPSTLVAQITDRMTIGQHNSPHTDRESFRLLLREILEGSDTTSQPDGNIGDDAAVNSRLICVIVRAGLGQVQDFSPVDEQNSIALDCVSSLQAIDLTVSRCPDALFHPLDAFEPKITPGSPLFAWLIPKVLAEIRELDSHDIGKQVLGVINRSILIEESRGTRYGRKTLVATYVHACITDLLSSIEYTVRYSNRLPTDSSHAFPSSTSIRDMFPEVYTHTDDVASYQISPRDQSHSFSIVVLLLSGLLSQMDGVQQRRRLGRQLSLLEFFLNSLGRVWTALNANVCFMQLLSSFSTGAFIRSLRDLLRFLIGVAKMSTNVSKISLLLNRVLSVTLVGRPIEPKSFLESEVCQVLLDMPLLAQQSKYVLHSHMEILSPMLSEIVDNPEHFLCLTEKLQHAIMSVLPLGKVIDVSLCTTEYGGSNLPPKISHVIRPDEVLVGNSESDRDTGADTGPRKRVRIEHDNGRSDGEDIGPMLSRQVCQVLGLPKTTALTEAFLSITDLFPGLDEASQCTLLFLLGQVACAGAKSLNSTPTTCMRKSTKFKCSICDDLLWKSQASPVSYADSNGLLTVLANLTKLPQMHRLGKPRVAAMLATQRALVHCKEQAHLDLTASVLGQCCLQALRSSSRDLRIAAGRTLPAFLRSDLDHVVLRRNSVSALDFLRNLSEKSELSSQETCILAWGQVARVSSGDEMNIVLLRLIEYIGHTNPVVCGLAYDEIQRMCQHSSFSVQRLLAPYWRTLAPTVVQDLQRRPQIAQYLSDLMFVTVSELLRLTQIYTLPYFVLTKKQGILQRIADACSRSVKEICMEPVNMSTILAYILLQSPSEAEVTIMTALQVVSSEFMNVDCADLIKAEPVLIALELLKAAGDADDASKSKARPDIAGRNLPVVDRTVLVV
ncbi:MAG: hypothetical protein Q9209_000946 [Squamulea sp. 1 TL-2023]